MNIVYEWLKIPGRTRGLTAREIAEFIEEKWGDGTPVDDERVAKVKTDLNQLVAKGVVKVDSEPRFL